MPAFLQWLSRSPPPAEPCRSALGTHASDRARAQPLAAVLVLVIETVVALERDPATGYPMMTSEAPGHASRSPAITIASTASLSTSRILRGRSMRGAALARQRARQRRFAAVTRSGRSSDRDSAMPNHSWLPGVPAAPIPMLENLRGRKVARSLAVGYRGGARVEPPASRSAASSNPTAESGKGNPCGPPSPHHLTCGSASGGSAKRGTFRPE